MEEFHKMLKVASNTLILLSREFERLEVTHADLLCEDYPFSVCLLEVVHNMLNWQETINNHVEAMRLGESENS